LCIWIGYEKGGLFGVRGGGSRQRMKQGGEGGVAQGLYLVYSEKSPIHISMYVNTCLSIYLSICQCRYIYTDVYVYIYTYIYTYICTYIYIYRYTFTDTFLYMHIYTQV